MRHRFAFVGFRHPHIVDMLNRCEQSDQIDVVARCEEHAETRAQLASEGKINVTHTDYGEMLSATDCDIVAVGDAYGLRAERILAALEADKHVISDKPLCTSSEQLEQIFSLADRKQRVVGCMLDMRDLPIYTAMRDAIQAGAIGEVHALSFEGQHPLMYGKRPSWYFEPGMHGGVFNDICIHAVDVIPWMTGQGIESVTAARSWNATLPGHPHFEQCGQTMFALRNGAGVMGDVSYLTPDSFGYTFPGYWRFTIWGAGGVLEGSVNSSELQLFQNGAQQAESLPLPQGRPGGYLSSFLSAVNQSPDGYLAEEEIRSASRWAMQIQSRAD